MGALSNLLKRGKKVPDPALKNSVITATAQGEAMRGATEADIAWKQNLAFKFEAIHDEDLEAVLDSKVMIRNFIIDVDKDGKIAYRQNEQGQILLDGNGNPIPVLVEAYTVDNTYASIRNMISHCNRLVFLEPKNAKLVELLMEDILETAKMGMTEPDYDLGTGSYLDSLGNYVFLMVNDAMNGNKVKSMFEITKRQTFEVQENKGKKRLF